MKMLKIQSKTLMVISVAAILALLSFSAASAIFYDINTNNASGSDWASVQVFATDAEGDLNSGCTTEGCTTCTSGQLDTDDIIETYVATGPTTAQSEIYFRVRFKAPYTGTSPVSAPQYHAITAYLDCPPYGKDDADVSVAYFAKDSLTMGDGNLPNPNSYVPYDPPVTTGERPASPYNDTLEWSVSLADIEGLTSSNCAMDGQGNYPNAYVSFAAVLVNNLGLYSCTFDEAAARLFSIPTAVELGQMQASSARAATIWGGLSLASLAGAIVLGAGTLLRLRKRAKS